MKFLCPACLHSWERPGEIEGDDVVCPQCEHHFRISEARTITDAPPLSEVRLSSNASRKGELMEGAVVGQYRILGILGRGGMGCVYKAEHGMLGRKVALKTLSEEFVNDTEFIQRFHREAKALANLSHPGIVAIHDMGTHQGTYYFVMEMVDGISIRDWMQSQQIPTDQAMKIIPQLCEAMEYAHGQGIIHRDIKPENILISKDGQAKIADFGLAKIVRGEDRGITLTQTNIIMGTMEYMAPEQRDSLKKVDHRADIYSLGVVLYEMLTGELPVGNFEPPSQRVGVSTKVDDIVLKSLQNNPEKRYQRASQLGREVIKLTSPAAAANLPSKIQVPEKGDTPAHRLSDIRAGIPRLPSARFTIFGILTLGNSSVFYIFRVHRWLRETIKELRGLAAHVPVIRQDEWSEIDEVSTPHRAIFWFFAIWISLLLSVCGFSLYFDQGMERTAYSLFFVSGHSLKITLLMLYLSFLKAVRRGLTELMDRVEALCGGRSDWAAYRLDLQWTLGRIVGHSILVLLSLVVGYVSLISLIVYPIGICFFWNSRRKMTQKILRPVESMLQGMDTSLFTSVEPDEELRKRVMGQIEKQES